jgi:peptidyl-prolyl cis-trans isomerase C
MYPRKRQIAWVAALALALFQWQPTARGATPDKTVAVEPDTIIASGTGFQIKRSQLDDAYVNYDSSLAATGGKIPENERSQVRSNLLQHLILTKILLQMATVDDKAQIIRLVDGNIAEARSSAPSPEAFEAQIKATGMTLQQVRDKAVEEQLCKRILERATTNGIVISDAAARKFYDDNADKFEQPEEVRASHILISTLDPLTQKPLSADKKKEKEQLAKSIKARADKGEDFVSLVKQYSDDPGSKNKGGEYTFPRHRMVPEFEAAAFSLKVNQISDLVETQYGYHIIKLLEKIPAKKVAFADVQVKIKSYLVEEQADKVRPAYLHKIEDGANVTLLDPASGKFVPAPKVW